MKNWDPKEMIDQLAQDIVSNPMHATIDAARKLAAAWVKFRQGGRVPERRRA